MKKFLLSGAALLIASTLAVAAPVKVGVSIANFDDTFLTYMMDGMKAYAKAHPNDVQLTFTDAKEDMAKQLDQVENFIVQKMDAIIVVPVDTSATAPMTKNMLAKNIKAVYVNRNPGNLPDGAYYVGSEEIVAGRLQMEFLGEKLKGKGNVAIMMGKLDNEGALKRTAGSPANALVSSLSRGGVATSRRDRRLPPHQRPRPARRIRADAAGLPRPVQWRGAARSPARVHCQAAGAGLSG